VEKSKEVRLVNEGLSEKAKEEGGRAEATTRNLNPLEWMFKLGNWVDFLATRKKIRGWEVANI